MATQADYRVTATLGELDLDVTHLEWREALSECFSCTLDVIESIYTTPTVGDAELIDKFANITLWQGTTVKRRLHGIIDRVAECGGGPRYRAYTIHISPALQRLDHTANCRIFQLKTVDEIIGEVLKQRGVVHFNFDLAKPKARREYCVQYNETDLVFIQRLAAEEGLIFWFSHDKNVHKLNFTDRLLFPRLPGAHPVRAQSAHKNEASIWSFTYEEQRVTSSSAQRDYTFKNPRYGLAHQYQGLYLQNQRRDYEHYSYNGRYKTDEQGKPFVQYRQEARQSAQRIATLTHDHLHFAAAQGIEIAGVSERHDHLWTSIRHQLVMPQPQALKEDAVDTGAQTDSQAGGQKVVLTTTCIPWSQPWRPQPLKKPVIEGPQVAHVVGPQSEEIFCDEFGRVRVQFPWDRYGNSDEYSSCWIRVAQHSAGGQYGSIAIPRIGHEVLVAFLEGDPDQPIIIGRTFHQDNRPPYPLPMGKTCMTLKSQTHKGKGFNELRFEDGKDREELFIHAQKDQNNVVLNNETTKVGVDRSENVGHDETITIGNDRTETVTNNETITINNDRTETVNHDETITINNDRRETVKNNEAITVEGHQSVNVVKTASLTVGEKAGPGGAATGMAMSETVNGGQFSKVIGDRQQETTNKWSHSAPEIHLKAGKSITLEVGSSKILMEPEKITISCGGSSTTLTPMTLAEQSPKITLN